MNISKEKIVYYISYFPNIRTIKSEHEDLRVKFGRLRAAKTPSPPELSAIRAINISNELYG